MIYLNNAATSYPKPESVKAALMRCVSEIPDALQRGTGPTGVIGCGNFDLCRRKLAALFNTGNPERIFFTSGATESLNLIARGMRKDPDSRVLATATEHNSVLRPLYEEFGASRVDIVPCDRDGIVNPDSVRSKIDSRTVAFFVNHCSNVSGAVQDLGALKSAIAGTDALFVVDASQSAGEIPIDIAGCGIDVLAFTAHKGLCGIQGTGGIYIRDGVYCRPLKSGGTGVDSWKLQLSEEDFSYEAGTQNGPGIAALEAGVDSIFETGIGTVRDRVHGLITRLYDGLARLPGVRVIGTPSASGWGPLLSFTVDGFLPSDIGFILSEAYGIRVRTGLHCAPLIHECLGTAPHGTVRVSPSFLTPEADVDALIAAVSDIVAGSGRRS